MGRVTKYLDSYKKYDWKTIGNGNAVGALADCILSRLIDGTNTEQFISLEFFKKSQRERNRFVTNRKTVRLEKKNRAGVTKEELDKIGNKVVFDSFFTEYVHRDYLGTLNASAEEIEQFILRYQKVLAKPVSSTQGKGIELIEFNPTSVKEIANRYAGKDCVIEEFITQHPELSRINPTSVNTIRVCTVLDDNHQAHVIGAAIRCGGRGSSIDNFHNGGLAYPIDVETGTVCGGGKNNTDEKRYSYHPSSGVYMIGLKIPNWDILLSAVKTAAEKLDRLAYLGWDVAVTEEGIELIEGNYGQGCTIWQLDNVGKYDQIRRLIRK